MKKNHFFLFALAALTVQAQENMINGHEYVDLGLPSGTLWATCNVGANSPEEYGDYFMWGETEPKEVYMPNNYKWFKSVGWDYEKPKWVYDSLQITKYVMTSKYGVVDNRLELELEDDAAYANWGSGWMTPTPNHLRELGLNCEWEEQTLNGVVGMKGTGPNGNSIFIPHAGEMFYSTIYYAGESVTYWTRVLWTSSFSSSTHAIKRSGGGAYGFTIECSYQRTHAFPIRPVVMKSPSQGVILNADNFPDANFRQALAARFNISEFDELSDAPCEITADQIAATTQLNISGRNIRDLTGIENFTELNTLFCYGNQIKGEAMDALIASLPREKWNTKYRSINHDFVVIDKSNENEGNICTKSQIAIAKEKGWNVYSLFSNDSDTWHELGTFTKYDGEESTAIDGIESIMNCSDSWYSVDGVKLNGEPAKKGIYIRNGKKVVK